MESRIEAELAATKEKLELVEKQRSEFAAALTRQADKCQAWQAAFERIDEDNMRPEDFGALYAVYQRTNDSEAQDAADAILARVKRAAQAEALDFIVDVDDATIARMTGPREATQVLREYAAALRRGEELAS